MSAASGEVVAGLEGVLAFESSVAYIDGNGPELSVRGYSIEQIAATMGYEEMAFLLWHERPPSDDELADFRAELAELREAPEAVLRMVAAAPSSAHPMAVLRTAVSMVGADDPNANDVSPEDNLRKAARLTAVMPTIVAAQVRTAGGETPVPPDASLGHAANYLHMVTGAVPRRDGTADAGRHAGAVRGARDERVDVRGAGRRRHDVRLLLGGGRGHRGDQGPAARAAPSRARWRCS